MSNHIRKQIRDAIKTLLTNLNTTGSRVEASRVDPYTESDCPALNIKAGSENQIVATSAGYPSRLSRTMNVTVSIHVKQNNGYDDAIDTIIKEIETALFASSTTFTLSGAARGGVRIAEIGEPDFDGDSEETLARCDITLTATYFADQNAPTTPL